MIKIIDNFNMVTDNIKLERFIKAQDENYDIALNEIEVGCKKSHWIWYVFPQIVGLGKSEIADFYSIKSKKEAESYLEDPILGSRLRQITTALLKHRDQKIENIMGPIDAMKLKSSMTLFDALSPNDIFSEILACFYKNEKCQKTLAFFYK